MDPKREVLEFLREFLGDRSINYNTSLLTATEDAETDILSLCDELEVQFGIELDSEELAEVEAVGELCALVAEAQLAEAD